MNKVAQVTLLFWLMKVLANTLGETLGDQRNGPVFHTVRLREEERRTGTGRFAFSDCASFIPSLFLMQYSSYRPAASCWACF